MSGAQGLDLREDGEDFILSVKAKDDSVSEVRLSEDQMMALIQSAPLFYERLIRRYQASNEGVAPVLVTPIEYLEIAQDSLGTMALLTVQASNRGRLTYGLSPRAARLILELLPPVLSEIETASPTRQ